MTIPTSPNPWFAGFSFFIPWNFTNANGNEIIAQGGGGYLGGNPNSLAFYIAQAGTGNPYKMYVGWRANTGYIFNAVSLATLTRDTGYFVVFGSTAANTWFVTIINVAGLDQNGNPVYNQSVSTSGQTASGGMLSCLGCSGTNAWGFCGAVSNAFMAYGTIQNASGVPVIGASGSGGLLDVAMGKASIKSYIAAQSATLHYLWAPTPSNIYAADPSGTVTTVMSPTLAWTPTNSMAGIPGDPIIPQPWLTLQPEGDNGYYVWGANPGFKDGKVWFRGTYATANGVIPRLEACLYKRSDGSVWESWQPLQNVSVTPTPTSLDVIGGIATGLHVTLNLAQPFKIPIGEVVIVTSLSLSAANGSFVVTDSTPWSVTYASTARAGIIPSGGYVAAPNGLGAGTYSGYITAPAGTGFQRSIRFAGQAATEFRAFEKHGVGLHIGWHAQSQTQLYFNGGNAANNSSSVAPTDTSNTFCSVCWPWFGSAAANADVDQHIVRPLQATSYGIYQTTITNSLQDGAVADPAIIFANEMMAITGLPIMMTYMAKGGHSPQNFWCDNQLLSDSGTLSGGAATLNATTYQFNMTCTGTTATVTAAGGFIAPGDVLWGGPIVNSQVSIVKQLTGTFGSNGAYQLSKPLTVGSSTTVNGGRPVTWPAAGTPNPLGGAYPSTVAYKSSVAPGNEPMILPGSFSMTLYNSSGVAYPGTVTDDGNNNLVFSGFYSAGTGTITYSSSSVAPSIAISAMPFYASGQQISASAAFTATCTLRLCYQGSSAGPTSPITPFQNLGRAGIGHAGFLSDAMNVLSNNVFNAVCIPWWTTWAGDASWTSGTNAAGGSLTYTLSCQDSDGIKAMFRNNWPNNLSPSCKFFFAAAGRDFSQTIFNYNRLASYKYAALATADTALLADNFDIAMYQNQGPHQDPSGGVVSMQRHAYAVAAGLGYTGTGLNINTVAGLQPGTGAFIAPVLGPVLTKIVRTSSTVLTLTYALPNGTSLSTYDGRTSNGTLLAGFYVGQSSSSQAAAFSGRVSCNYNSGSTPAVSAAIASATTVTLTLNSTLGGSATWYTSGTGYISVSYADQYIVSTGTTNGGNDALSQAFTHGLGLVCLLCDNSGVYTAPGAGASFVGHSGDGAGGGTQTTLTVESSPSSGALFYEQVLVGYNTYITGYTPGIGIGGAGAYTLAYAPSSAISTGTNLTTSNGPGTPAGNSAAAVLDWAVI